VLRATLEAWADDKTATIDALKRRLLAKGSETSFDAVMDHAG
jgi:hypothetical protein